jgi:flagella basal body P-ring formation protein FlgA
MSTRRTVQLMVILTLLAWATQTLFTQWGYGGLIISQPVASPAKGEVILEVRSEIRPQDAAIIRLRDVCRWSQSNAGDVDGYADLILANLSEGSGTRRVNVADIRAVLHEAGVNLSGIQFAGAASCVIAVEGVNELPGAGDPGATPQAAVALTDSSQSHALDEPQTTLRDLLVGPLLRELGLVERDVQVDFEAKDEAVLALTSPRCGFRIDASRAGDLGAVAWNIVINDRSDERTVTLAGTVRVWEDQVVLKRALSSGQMIMEKDLISRRVLVEQRMASLLSDAKEAVGQIAGRDLQAEQALTPEDLAPQAMVTKGDFINVSLEIGGLNVATVARAMQGGAKGEVISARNEATRDVYRVVVTGVSAGEVIGE